MYPFTQNSVSWPQSSGIYMLRSLFDSKVYIGQTADKEGFKGRLRSHRTDLRGNRHGNRHLQNAFNLRGEDNYEWCILETIESNNQSIFNEKEAYWISKYHSTNESSGYNLHDYDDRNNIKLSESTKAIIAKKATGRKASKETKQKISDSWRTRTVSEETRAKISKSMKGHTHTEESKKKMSQTQKGRPKTKEHCEKVSEGLRRFAENAGENHPNAKIVQCTSPDGKIISIKNLSLFCRENGLQHSCMLAVCNGKRGSHKGYRSLTYVFRRHSKKRYDFMAPDGSIKECYNTEAFAREHGVSANFLRDVAKGHMPTRKKWRLVRDYRKKS